MRLIDADALQAEYKQYHGGKRLLLIDTAPTVEPRPRGRWINHRKDRGHNIADCDQCGGTLQWLDPDERPNYCPTCGAEMRLREEETG